MVHKRTVTANKSSVLYTHNKSRARWEMIVSRVKLFADILISQFEKQLVFLFGMNNNVKVSTDSSVCIQGQSHMLMENLIFYCYGFLPGKRAPYFFSLTSH